MGFLPEINRKIGPCLCVKDAYHPLTIFITIRKLKRKDISADQLELQQDSRIIVISGPNAGGKSITLKTSWYSLQVMLQSGLC